MKSIPDFRKASFHAQLLIAQTAVYSPDPRRPPLYLALPLVLDPKDGWLTMLPAMDLWDDDPLGRIPRSAPALKRLSIFVDAGLQDGFPDIPANVRRLDSTLTAMSIPHEAELYEGTHGNRVRERVVRRMLPFFSRAFARPR